MSNMGLFEAEMSSDSFQLLGMAEMGMIPAILPSSPAGRGTGRRRRKILCSAAGVVVLSFMSFQKIIEFLKFLYELGMLAVFAAFVKLRVKDPDLPRSYRIPVGKESIHMPITFPGSISNSYTSEKFVLLKWKHDREDNEIAGSNDWMMSPGYANTVSSPVPTPPSGKGSKISAKSKAAKGQKSCPQTPLCSVGPLCSISILGIYKGEIKGAYMFRVQTSISSFHYSRTDTRCSSEDSEACPESLRHCNPKKC